MRFGLNPDPWQTLCEGARSTIAWTRCRFGRAAIFLLLAGSLPATAAEAKLKAGFIYVGPISDFGWTHGHEEARLRAEKEYPWLKTSYVESVADADLESVVDQMVDQGVKVIFTTSTSYMEGTVACATRYPDVMFFNAAGYQRAPNLATYGDDPYQCAYLQGLSAGVLSKTGKVGSVSCYPTPDVVRILNAFMIGLHTTNPKAEIRLRWLNSWYDPPAAKEAAETLIAEGVDFLISDMDAPTVAQVAEVHDVPVISEGFNAQVNAPKSLVTSDVFNWVPAYLDIFKKIHAGIYTPKSLQNVDLWLRLAQQSVLLTYQPGVPFNPRYQGALKAAQVNDPQAGKMSAYDLIFRRFSEMSANPIRFEPYTGPLIDATGKLEIPAGQMATKAQLFSITWRLPGIVGSWPVQ